ncbi:MAG: hypothetical protein JWM96_693 [Alphaproteobacteria bacterium]|nr:hypothetical protein [Alphaproteobacteria bacterium]
MKMLLIAAMLLLSLPAFAQDQDQAPAEDSPAGISLDGVWRSDAGLLEAEKLLGEKKYTEALTVLDDIITRNMRNADAHVYSAVAWLNLGNKDKAKTELTNALAIDRGHMGAYVMSGLVALMENNLTQANYFLSALKVVCRGTMCPEYQRLQKIIREMGQ